MWRFLILTANIDMKLIEYKNRFEEMSTIVWILNFCIDLTCLSFWWIQKKGLAIKVGQIWKDIACSIFHRILKIGTACRSTKQICLFTVSNGLTYWNRQSCIRSVYFLIKCSGNNSHFFCYYALQRKILHYFRPEF